MYGRSPFGATVTSSPATSSILSNAFAPASTSPMYSTSPNSERHAANRGRAGAPLSTSLSDPVAFGSEPRPAAPAIVIRKLPLNISTEALGSMLIFAADLLDTEIIRSPYQEDKGFATAVARFGSHKGALDAQQKLHGKPNTTKEANMIVEIHSGSMVGSFDRRNTIDIPAPRTQTSSASSGGSAGAPPSRSRFNGAFQSTDKISPPLTTPSSGGSGDFPIPESSTHFQTLFSPQSPVSNGIDDRRRVTGKSMINNDAVDDETGELLKDPIGYAKSGQQLGRRSTNPQIPLSRFGSLSLSTPNGSGSNLGSPTSNGLASPRGAGSMQMPVSPTGFGSGSNGNGLYNPMNYSRPQYPPINPADQNPPCNTLYVGNLPIDTSEDELKAIFSKQRGYKRLCFRTKQNGPMCFVEFEDISFATKALNELYGHPLHNSVKGGIRLSFSKNPLGVRSGQANSIGAHTAMTPQALAPGYSGHMHHSSSTFSSVSGPPPGLTNNLPGLNGGYRSAGGSGAGSTGPIGTGMNSMFAHPFAMTPQDFTGQLRQQQTLSGGVPPSMNGSFGRDSRYTDYTLGR